MEQPAWRHANQIIARYSSAIDYLCSSLPFHPDRTSLGGRLLSALVRLPPRLLMFVWELATSFSRSKEQAYL